MLKRILKWFAADVLGRRDLETLIPVLEGVLECKTPIPDNLYEEVRCAIKRPRKATIEAERGAETDSPSLQAWVDLYCRFDEVFLPPKKEALIKDVVKLYRSEQKTNRS